MVHLQEPHSAYRESGDTGEAIHRRGVTDWEDSTIKSWKGRSQEHAMRVTLCWGYHKLMVVTRSEHTGIGRGWR